ncbi:MAG: hypothetical protein VX780_01200, partial [Pseudomonadota bacterium]|nr:hypothetical protein [Pseudomonadota bacterium]
LVEANTGITLNFERQWGETANSPAKACDPCVHPPDHLEKLILYSIGNVKIADLARKQKDHKDQ